jgi:hypothetical protein
VSSSDVALHPLSSTGGISSPPTDARNPFEVLDDLMQVVEALCPAWPRRELFPPTAVFKL